MKLLLFQVLFPSTFGAKQAHLPLAPGLPDVPTGTLSGLYYVGDTNSFAGKDPHSAGSKSKTIDAALRYDPADYSALFHEWDVNHIKSGPAYFDCPDGFHLTQDNFCVFVEYIRPELSCPYGTFKDRVHSGCIQIDSVPPEKLCPAGFQYFMRGCIRRTRIPPNLTCPPGYSQIDNSCYSASSVPPVLRCPPGFAIFSETSCHQEFIARPEYDCPPGSSIKQASAFSGKYSKVLPGDDPKSANTTIWNVANQLPTCQSSEDTDPVITCPPGFSLAAADQIDLRQLAVHSAGDDSFKCAKIAEFPGVLQCPTEHELVWLDIPKDMYKGARCVKMEDRQIVIHDEWSPKWLNAKSDVIEYSQQMALNMSQANNNTEFVDQKDLPEPFHVNPRWSDDGKPDLVTLLNENIEIYEDPAPTTNTPGSYMAPSRKRTMKVSYKKRNLLGSVEAFAAHDLPSTDISKTEFIPRIYFERVSCSGQDHRFLKWVGLDVTGQYSPVCREIQTMEPVLSCPTRARVKCVDNSSGKYIIASAPSKCPSKTTKPICQVAVLSSPARPYCSEGKHLVFKPLVSAGGSATLQIQVGVCHSVVEVDAQMQCPFGVGHIADSTGRCDVLLAEPLAATCPEGFTVGTAEKDDLKGPLAWKFKKVDEGRVGICELLEYADYQINCPEGYTRNRAKNTPLTCVAEKLVSSSILCPPGFVLAANEELVLKNSKACVKQVVVAPTVVARGEATACMLTKENRLSCGVERKFHGMTDFSKQRAFGESLKSKTDRKIKQHTDRYSSS